MVPAIKSLKLDYMPYSLSIDHIFKVLMEHNCKVTVSSLKLLCACVCTYVWSLFTYLQFVL